jgi:two-component system, NarL family, nitrate/nitrite response regulator NarL
VDGARPLRLIVFAEDALAGTVFRDRLFDAGGVEVIAVVSNASELSGPLSSEAIDGLLWDLGIRPEAPDLPEGVPETRMVIALTDDAHAAAEALAAGAHAVLGRAREGRALAAAFRAVASGLHVDDPRLEVSSSSRARRSSEELTRREQEVVELLVEGLTNRDIAARLHISEHTAKFHVNSVLQKLGAQSRTEAVVKAARRGLITL